MRGRAVGDDLDGGEDVDLAQRRLEVVRLGERGEEVAAEVEHRTDVAGADLVGEHGAGPFAEERVGLRSARRSGAERTLGRRHGQLERFELVGEPGVEPVAAGAVHRVGEDHHHPGQPLGDVGARRHRDPGAGVDRHATGRADRGEQLRRARRSGRRRRRAVCSSVNGSTAAASSSTPLACARRAATGRRRRGAAHARGTRGPRSRSPDAARGGAWRGARSRCDAGRRPRPRHELASARMRRHRIRDRDRVAVRHDRVAADEHDERRTVVVGPSAERDRAADEVGHQHLGGAVDGERAELGRRADRREQRLRHAVAGRVHAVAAAEEHADRGRPVALDDLAHAVAEVVEARVPGGVAELAVDPHHAGARAVGVVVHLRERAALRAGVAVRERVVLVAADAHDVVARHVDEDPAHRGADPAEAPDRAHVAVAHRSPLPFIAGARADAAQQEIPEASAPTSPSSGRRSADRRRERVEHRRLQHHTGDPAVVEAGPDRAGRHGVGEQALEQLDERRERVRRLLRVRRRAAAGRTPPSPAPARRRSPGPSR